MITARKKKKLNAQSKSTISKEKQTNRKKEMEIERFAKHKLDPENGRKNEELPKITI